MYNPKFLFDKNNIKKGMPHIYDYVKKIIRYKHLLMVILLCIVSSLESK